MKNLAFFSDSALTRAEMKSIKGGGSCCVTVIGNTGGSRNCDYSTLNSAKKEATTVASWGGGVHAYYCCDNCSSHTSKSW